MLDPTPIVKGADTKKRISSPPPFILPEETIQSPPALTPNTGRGRGRLRSSSPGKAVQSTKKIHSPRKRTTKTSNAASLTNADPTITNEIPSGETADNQVVAYPEKVHVEVDAAVDINGAVDTEHTKVKVDVLSDRAAPTEPPGPVEAAKMIATAQKMVEGARKIDGILSHRAPKRKADELDVEEDEEILMGPPAKETKVLEQQLKTEKVKTKALLGLSATLAVGYDFYPPMRVSSTTLTIKP